MTGAVTPPRAASPRGTPVWLYLLDLAAVTDRPTVPEVRRRVSGRVARLVLARHLGCRPARVPLVRAPSGRPVVAGESVDRCRFSVSHDERLLAVAYHPPGCGVDVESVDPALLAEVAPRFCAPGEDAAEVAALRALWAAKESVAKALGEGLAARLSTITFDADPGARWAPARWRGLPTGLLTRVVAYPDRHVALSIHGAVPPPVTVIPWRPRHPQTPRHRRPAAVGRVGVRTGPAAPSPEES